MTTTDHYAEARASLDNAWGLPRDPNLLLDAQVHATLALVEQQRLANLIAWATANGHEPIESVKKTIREGLGL